MTERQGDRVTERQTETDAGRQRRIETDRDRDRDRQSASHTQHAHRESATAALAPPAAPLDTGLFWARAGESACARKLQAAAERELNTKKADNVMEPGVGIQDDQGQVLLVLIIFVVLVVLVVPEGLGGW